MLAKQAWRIAMLPDCPLHQIFKHNYFPNSNYFAAEGSYSPSFMWRSILGARDLLAAGMRWSIGDGESITIMGVPWIPKPSSFQVICPPRSLDGLTKVVELMDETGWKDDMVRGEFSQIDAECILSIPLSRVCGRDKLIWHYGKQGIFSVRSAYGLACTMATIASSSNMARKWTMVWNLHLAPKMRLFIWKVCFNALPTMMNLRNRGVRGWVLSM
ncbi:UNVERIFIED_CONTAM: hypothetical protein Slati_2774500 [Sesamum latifolium]|uniref:Reverse transcriptase zinc-binding domain-containing protein n=1 Tax=Sesamum latifolium TaxID=2727402 RepID=A0AAW2W282_9LAMI